MNPLLLERTSTADGAERRRLLSDLFHALNQPLTSLCCSLELALREEHIPPAYRHSVREALQQTEQVTLLANSIREFIEAEEPGGELCVLELQAYLREVFLDFLPMARSNGVLLSLACSSPCRVRLEAHWLRQALFHVLEFVLDSAGSGAEFQIHLGEEAGEAVLLVSTLRAGTETGKSFDATGAGAATNKLLVHAGLGVARRVFEAAGGSLQKTETYKGLQLQVRAPLAPPAE